MSALGHFEPSFYGVTTHLWTDEHVATLWAYAGTEDVGAWANAIGDSSLSHLGPISALDHEVRHFHDALLSPWGCNIMGLRLQILINGMQVLGAVAEAPGLRVAFCPSAQQILGITNWKGTFPFRYKA